MNTFLLKQFFAPIESVLPGEKMADCDELKNVTLFLDKINDFLPQNSYIIDDYQRNFMFISKRSIFLCGYTEEEAMKMGYDFYNKILTPENLKKLIEINDVVSEFFSNIPIEKKIHFSVTYDLVFQKRDGSSFCVNQKLKPFLFTKENNIWLSICCVRPSSNDKVGNVKCFFKETNESFSYSFEDKKWYEQPPFILSEVERFIIIETDNGTLEKQLAYQLKCTRSNIRYYKNMILKKTETKTIREAIHFLRWYYPEVWVDAEVSESFF